MLPEACVACLRRGWLLAQLSHRLELRGRDPDALLAALELDDQRLLAALAGKRAEELGVAWASFTPGAVAMPDDVRAICRHHAAFPAGLRKLEPLGALHVAGGLDRLRALTGEPVVAIAGTRRASEYGIEVARALARGLAASGVTVAGAFGEGIALAVHTGAQQIGRGSLAVMAGGVDVCRPAGARALWEAVRERGCLLSELPCGTAPRPWCELARARLLAALASLVVVVEAHEAPRELALAHLARGLGRPVAAVPGRVSSPGSRGAHALLRDGAQLVRDAQDVLELLGGPHAAPAPSPVPALTPALRRVLDRVASGEDTLAKLTSAHGRAARGRDAATTLMALAELELAGLIARAAGGRYVACVR